jgi:hypothetical protein
MSVVLVEILDLCKTVFLIRAIPITLAKFKQERDHYRVLGDESMSQALRVMMNSVYGLSSSRLAEMKAYAKPE